MSKVWLAVLYAARTSEGSKGRILFMDCSLAGERVLPKQVVFDMCGVRGYPTTRLSICSNMNPREHHISYILPQVYIFFIFSVYLFYSKINKQETLQNSYLW